jgi:hypothetical protein
VSAPAPLPALGWIWSDVDPAAHFAADYADARARFLAAAARHGLAVETHVHPTARGPADEPLAVDVAVLGDAASDALLITSGTHGAEGFCGSGCQVALLADDAFVATLRSSGVALVLVHALNPFGFAHLSRTTEDNVDLNRNFRDFARLHRNADYAEVHDFMVPASWPPAQDNEARMMGYVMKRGAFALQQAVSGGQSDHPDGLFFAGRGPAWSHGVLRDVLRRHAASRERLGWIDVHTGLGPCGHGEKIFSGPDDAAMLARARRWWGADVTSIYEGSSTSARVEGMLCHAALDECPDTEYTGIALEYGTQSYVDVMNALRARQWLANHADAAPSMRDAILRQVRAAFYVDTPAWKAMVFAQARVAALQAIAALSRR